MKINLIFAILILLIMAGCEGKNSIPSKEELDPTLIYGDYQSYDECIINISKSSDYGDSAKSNGLIIVFHENMTEDGIDEFFSTYNLEVKSINAESKRVTLDIPSNLQRYWICKLKGSERIKEISLNRRLKAI